PGRAETPFKFESQRPASESRPYKVLFGGCVCSVSLVCVFAHEVESGGFLGRELCGFGNFLDRRGNGHFRQQLNVAVVLEARTGRDETAHDDVFLEAAEVVHLTGDGSFSKDASRLLEAGSRNERIGRERSLSDAKEKRTARCRAAAFFKNSLVLFAEAE